jgi:diguanylate cyclase (GGDEF)-like protein
VLNITAELCGNRFGRGLVRPGGVGYDLDDALIKTLRNRLTAVEKDVTGAVELLFDTPSVLARFEGTGTVSEELARKTGLVGVAARASGIDCDVRREFPYGLYRFARPNTATGSTGDCFARAYVRWLEIRESLKFIRWQLTVLPEGPVTGTAVPIRGDLLAVSLRAGDEHRLVMAEGKNVGDLIGKKFPLTQGLVGQAIRVGAILPAGGRYPKPAPIFSQERTFGEFGSLLIFPLRVEGAAPLGALVVAGAAHGLFSKGRREIIELIATQVAIKVELAQAHDRLGQLATTDGLTGLANHRAFQHGFDVMLQRAKRNRTRLCLLMGDLDHFKQINDNHGHPFGDLVLREAARIIGETVRSVDLAARYGGEEFAVVLENCDATGGHQLAERIRESIAALALPCEAGEEVHPAISLGMAVFPEDGAEKDLLVERADQALYRAKNRGRNRTVLWLPGDED